MRRCCSTRPDRLSLGVAALLAIAIGGCTKVPPPPDDTIERYPLTGQVLAVRPDIREVRIYHDDIPGYMKPMTMSLGVKDVAEIAGLVRGDLVEATLAVSSTDAWLEGIRKVGHGEVTVDEEYGDDEPSQLAPVDLLAEGALVPDESLVDQDGTPWRPSDARGQALVVTFIDTRCPIPTACPLVLRYLRDVQQLISARDDLQGRVRIVAISFDPEFDTPEVLKAFGAEQSLDPAVWTLATGEAALVERYAGRFGVTIIRNPDRPADVRHNLRTAVVGPDGRIVRLLGGSGWTPAEVVATLAAAVASAS